MEILNNQNTNKKITNYLNALGIDESKATDTAVSEFMRQTIYNIGDKSEISREEFDDSIAQFFNFEIKSKEESKELSEKWQELTESDGENSLSISDLYSQFQYELTENIINEIESDEYDISELVELTDEIKNDNSNLLKRFSAFRDYPGIADNISSKISDYTSKKNDCQADISYLENQIKQSEDVISNLTIAIVNLEQEQANEKDKEKKAIIEKNTDEAKRQLKEQIDLLNNKQDELTDINNVQSELNSEILNFLDEVSSSYPEISSDIDKLKSGFEKYISKLEKYSELDKNYIDIRDSQIKSIETLIEDFKKDVESDNISATDTSVEPSLNQSQTQANIQNSANYSNSSYNALTDDNNYSVRTKEDIKNDLTNAQDDYDKKTVTFNSIIENKDSDIKKLKTDSDNKYDALYQKLNEIDPNLALELNNLKEKIDIKEEEYYNLEKIHAASKTQANDAKQDYINADYKLSCLNEQLDILLDEDSSEAQELISEIKKEINIAKQEKEEAKSRYKEVNGTVEGLDYENNNQSIASELSKLKTQMNVLISTIATKYPDLESLAIGYKDANDEYSSTKKDKIENAKTELISSNENINELKEELNKTETNELTDDYSTNITGDKLIEFAEKYLGYNGYDGSADIFWPDGRSASENAWCGMFVLYVLKNSGQYKNMPEYYKKHHGSSHSVYKAAKEAGAIIDSKDAKKGDLVVFDWEKDGKVDHIGFVVGTTKNKLITIEGNNGNYVKEVEYSLDDNRVYVLKAT